MAHTMKLTGTKAIIAIVIVVAVAGFQYHARQQTLQTDAVEQIKLYLAGEYASYHLPELQRATQTGQLTEERAEEIVNQVSMDNIEIVEISARGRSDRFVARVKIEVGGAAPPDGKRVRYYRLTHSNLSGWRVGAETGVWSYRLAW